MNVVAVMPNERLSRLRATSTGKRVSPTERDLLWFRKLAEHGPLPTSFLLQYCRNARQCEKRSRERLTDLFNEDNTPDGGPYLVRPPQQFATIDSRYNQLVHDLAPAAHRALARRGELLDFKRRHAGPWLHSHMVACVTASIELAALARDDITYIPQSAILTRADTELRNHVCFADPICGTRIEKELQPDALFGLEYLTKQGSRFRFFAVEADRATEPTTTANWNRKSFLRNLLQYEAYVAGGAYREHLSLTAPMLVINVTSDRTRMQRMLRLIAKHSSRGNNYQLFQCWEDFAPGFRPPTPNAALLEGDWARAAQPDIRIVRP